MSGFSFLIEWDQGNLSSALKHGVSKDACEDMIRSIVVLSANKELVVWVDTLHSRKEAFGERFVTTVHEIASGRNFFVCFTVRDRGTEKAIRMIHARSCNKREPLMRHVPPKRFAPVPSLLEILGV